MSVSWKTALFLGLAVAFAQWALAQDGSEATSSFRVVPTPNENFDNGLVAASASSTTDIWAVGQSTIHWNGTKFTAYPAPMIEGNNTSILNGVVDVSPTLAWAGGIVNIGEANPGQVILQWNGTEWSVFPGPTFAAGDEPAIYAMTSTSADDIWAIGSLLSDDGEELSYLFEHWNGTAWTVTTEGNPGAFVQGASADATNDAWAVGYNDFADTSSTLALHYNGTTWSTVGTPNVGEGSNQLHGVLALAPDNVWAVGYSTPVAPPQEAATLTLIEHYDGTSWSVVSSPNVGPNSVYQSNRLFGLVANSADDIWAFGSYFASSGSEFQSTLLLHWNGTAWTVAPSPDPTKDGFLSDLLFAGVTPAPGNVWIFGVEDEAPHSDTLAIETITGGPRQ
jgi:hypothetical protein